MVFEAHYQKRKLVLLAGFGLAFLVLGFWMGSQPARAFDDSRKIVFWAAMLGIGNDSFGHGVGWACAAMGIAVLPIVAKNFRFSEPAMRIDEQGIYWHRWSPKIIAWSNVANYRPYSIYRQKMIGLTLRDPELDRSPKLAGRFAILNKLVGFGHLALSAQALDKPFDEMLQAVEYHIERQGGPS